MNRLATIVGFVVVSAQRCNLLCDSPFTTNLDRCKCECLIECDRNQRLDEENCECNAIECRDMTCPPSSWGEVSAKPEDFKYEIPLEPNCRCEPKEGEDRCDAKYGGNFKTIDGEECKKDIEEESNAIQLTLIAALAISAMLLV